MTLVEPVPDDDVIWFTPAMRENCLSSGVATAEAIVSGSAPGNDAPTLITGNSTCGRDATGSIVYAMLPAMRMAMESKNVATGRLIKGSEKFTPPSGRSSPA